MAPNALSKLARVATRQIGPLAAQRSSTIARGSLLRHSTFSIISQSSRIGSIQAVRSFSINGTFYKGLSPETDDPKPKEAEDHATASHPADLSVEEYNELSDHYMDKMVEKLEQLQEERGDVDVEYSAGVLTLTFPPNGTYVINKQPPNKQIWLSSPISGPKRYDFVVLGEGQDSKEGTGAGDWIYLRDGTSLSAVLLNEVGVDLSEAYETPSDAE